jgi:hypothetical protein
MGEETNTGSISKGALWTGRVMSAIPVAAGLMGGVMAVLRPESAVEGFVNYGYSESVFTILCGVEFLCALLYVIPRTAVLGAILFTGYFGGAVATHLTAGESNWYIAVVVGVFVWGGLFLRDPRIRALIPINSKG